jgi:hypothetical protein
MYKAYAYTTDDDGNKLPAFKPLRLLQRPSKGCPRAPMPTQHEPLTRATKTYKFFQRQIGAELAESASTDSKTKSILLSMEDVHMYTQESDDESSSCAARLGG